MITTMTATEIIRFLKKILSNNVNDRVGVMRQNPSTAPQITELSSRTEKQKGELLSPFSENISVCFSRYSVVCLGDLLSSFLNRIFVKLKP